MTAINPQSLMQTNKHLENLQLLQTLCIWGVFIFGSFAGLCGAGIKIYDNRIKKEESKLKSEKESQKKIEGPSIENAKNIYNISGDMVIGEKKTTKPVRVIKEKANITINIADTNLGPNPFFTYKNGDLDFHFSIYAVNDAVAVIEDLKVILVRLDEKNQPLEFKIFKGSSLPEKNLVYSNSPLNHTQKMGNLPLVLTTNLYLSIDLVVRDENKTLYKNERYIYRIRPENTNQKIPNITKQEFKIVDDYLNTALPKE